MNAPLPNAEARRLLAAAHDAMRFSAPHVSKFPVGAALHTMRGETITGCNIESPSLLQVFCAERVALLKALSEGHGDFTHIAVVAEKRALIAPCGLCRQMLMEFAPELIVITEDKNGEPHQKPLTEYLPEAFVVC